MSANNDPPLVGAREEFLHWLDEVPELNRNSWQQRLLSNQDHPHFSVRLELYLHHHFKANSWSIGIEPDMVGSPNKPDFKVAKQGTEVIVEAKTLLDDEHGGQQARRLRQLADEISNKLARTVIIQPLSNLPSSLPAKRIRSIIEQSIPAKVNDVVEFQIDDQHQAKPFSLKIAIIPAQISDHEAKGVQGLVSNAQTITTHERVRSAD